MMAFVETQPQDVFSFTQEFMLQQLIYKPDYVIVTWFGQIFDIAM
jgi:hypothetical protein